ncbi:MAG: 3-oxoacyl-[acyl-carrier protein] reductase [uncultured Sphingosinicella sp.]|uniref:3-oxoacyl-[acyl-carrier protein] reductase n=1 Tax=uncultured Sphingosinicella sp. TaxID=478748 RepID=A0A6J4TUU2_9SPHN|nr:SDR family oxidoreductase [uncultured Sphingosinicella sp.]CAA9532278.1 MAG: 3-oxoacyl-[acyl-carrier protein] reductase [uncultured Sphingosinicella sp.]
MRLKEKVAIVTGAASGIGRATARLFASEGAHVVAADLNQPESADNIVGVRCDAGNEDDVQHLIRSAVARFGGLDIVFANAGVSGGLAGLFDQSVEDWQQILQVNLIGPFLAIKHAAPIIKERGGGSIICTASVAGLRSGAGGPAYSASKAGVISLVRTAAQQLATANVRVNAICPGLIETGMTQPIYDRARERGVEEKLGHLNPLRRGGEPHEIANAALFLASDESSYVNGHALVVDGGLSSSHPINRQDYGRTAH